MSDPREREPEPVLEPPPDLPVEDEDEDDEDEDLVARAANRAHCERLYGHLPCVAILGSDNVTVIRTEGCTDWCPVLRKPV